MIARAAAAAVLLLVGGCATLPPPVAGEDWPARRAALQSLEIWRLSGRIAVAAGAEGFSGGLDWAQAGERADIAFRGPVGGTRLAIRVDRGELTVTDERGASYGGEDAERLVAGRLGPGQPIPVESMRYWLVGAPAPGAPHEETLDGDRRLASLSQSGWQVRYDGYRHVAGLALPARLEMTTAGLRLRVVVSNWRLAP